ncbi:MAG: dihydroneopterin aldolase [Verrucomicrobia bacterium]|nr:dihydroneopterin aldolase [Verrucomicrobiota bacterium]
MIERIAIEQFKVQAHVGVPLDERSQPQRLVLNISLTPARTEPRDELAATINYSAVAKIVRETIGKRRYKLIETVAEETAAALLRQFEVQRVSVEVRKFVLADAEYVSVTAVREPAVKRVRG